MGPTAREQVRALIRLLLIALAVALGGVGRPRAMQPDAPLLGLTGWARRKQMRSDRQAGGSRRVSRRGA